MCHSIVLCGLILGQSQAPSASAHRMPVFQTQTSGMKPAATARAEDVPAVEDLTLLLEPLRKKHRLPALAGAIVAGGRLTAIGAVGHRRFGDETPVTIDDRWHIGSCTKAMTATLVGTFVDEGRLSWQTTLAEGFPDLKEKIHADYRGVTIEKLLAHRGGVPTDLSRGGLWLRLLSLKTSPTEQRRELLEGVLFHPPAYPPGEKYEYANGGYAIVGAMLETHTGQSWEDLMRRRLFEPLGMATAGFGAPCTEGRVDQPQGHTRRKGKPNPIAPGPLADNPPAIGPAGTVHCSIGDWGKFVADQVAGPRGDGRLLKTDTYRKIQTVIGNDYALGWIVAERPWGGRVLTHGGSNTMWFCVAWAAPEKDFAVLACTNYGNDKAFLGLDQAAAAMIGHHLAAEKRPTSRPAAKAN